MVDGSELILVWLNIEEMRYRRKKCYLKLEILKSWEIIFWGYVVEVFVYFVFGDMSFSNINSDFCLEIYWRRFFSGNKYGN